MRLADWMKDRELDDDRLAALVGVDRVTISRNRRGKTKPSETLLSKLRELSGGQVTANDFYHAEGVE